MGTRIAERYVIDDVIGVGGMGTVYSAVHEALDRHVAIKVMHPEYAQSREYRQRFEREARVLSRLRHPGAVAVHDFGEQDGMLFLVMDLLTGRSLRKEMAAGGALPLSRALKLGRQLAEVLSVAHAIPLVHRDLKPENVMIEPAPGEGDERAILVDFGLAFIGGAGGDLGRVTRSGLVPGTPHYVSPEQARSLELGPPSDVYSFACLLFEALDGEPPFDAPTAAELIAQHLFVPPPSLRARRPEQNFPEALDELLGRMLIKASEHRPTSAEVLDALDDVLAGGKKPVRGRPALSRASRMIDAPITTPPPLAAPARVGVVGEPPEGFALAAAGNQLGVVPLAPGAPPVDVDVVLALDLSVERVRVLAYHGRPVIATAPATDMPRMLELLRAGAADVVAWPLDIDDTMGKLTRLLRTNRRRRDE